MVTGKLNSRILRAGLSVVAALLLSAPTYAQGTGDGVVVHVIEPDFLGDGTGFVVDGTDGGPDVAIDDGDYIAVEPEPGDGGLGDDGLVDDGWVGDGWVDDGWVDDGWVDEGLDGGYDGEDVGPYVDLGEGVVDDGMVHIGGNPDFCEACGGAVDDLLVEAHQMSAAGIVTDLSVVVATKPRKSSAELTLSNNAAECNALHPQLPWLCEWQNSVGQ